MLYYNRVPLSYYELAATNVAKVRLTKELLEGTNLGEDIALRLFGGLAYRCEALEKALAGTGVLLVTERSRQNEEAAD